MNRILIAAPSSGSGKTLITCGILQALKKRGLKVSAYKCGPDYIDPMFHSEIIQVGSDNLDSFIMGDNFESVFDENADISVVEGVMGYYDGLGGISEEGSSYDIAKKINAPTVLVVDCRGMSMSAAAIVHGFLYFEADSRIKGVILNRVSPHIYEGIKKQIEFMGIKVLGYLPNIPECTFDSRHLGLIKPNEIKEIKAKLEILGEQIEKHIDLDILLKISAAAPEFKKKSAKIDKVYNDIKIAVAYDSAFCFYYKDNFKILRDMGAVLEFFSPICDNKLPENICGLILGGGYPELYAESLSGNTGMLSEIRQGIEQGMPCIAECGGFMYLHNTMEDADGKLFTMVGAINAAAFKTDKLKRFGYEIMTAKADNLLCKKGGKINAHEFHYWDSTFCGSDFYAEKPLREVSWDCVIADKTKYMGFPHIHFRQNTSMAENFLKTCLEYKNNEIKRSVN